MQNSKNSLVAATFEKAKPYVFAETLVRDREVGGSNPLAPTKNIRESSGKDHPGGWSFHFVTWNVT
jgi:hypothetical protein